MTKFTVSVEKRLYATGAVEIEAENADKAIEIVEERINKGELQTTAIEWGESEYEDMSFKTTGDVD